jgi:hypothetical protein
MIPREREFFRTSAGAGPELSPQAPESRTCLESQGRMRVADVTAARITTSGRRFTVQ